MEEQEKAKLIKDALKIVDELAKIDVDNLKTSENDITIYLDDYEPLEKLIKRANDLKKNKLWKL